MTADAIQITGIQISESMEALKALVAVDPTTSKPLYQFQPALKAALAKRIRQVQELWRDILELRQAKAKELGVTGKKNAQGEPEDNMQALADLHAYWLTVLADKYTPDMGRLKLSWFNLAQNDLPVTYLTVLDWLIEFDVEPESCESFPAKA